MTDVSEMTVDQIKAKLLEAGAALHTHRTIDNSVDIEVRRKLTLLYGSLYKKKIEFDS